MVFQLQGKYIKLRSTAIGGKTPMAKVIIVALSTPLSLSTAGGGRRAAAAVAARE
jgi:hypothetical protein